MKWISWFQPTEDYRPENFPPSNSVLGWWCTGGSDKGAVLVALVDAETEQQAQEQVLANWPEVVDWRFCEDRDSKVFNSRFPVNDWMKERGLSNE